MFALVSFRHTETSLVVVPTPYCLKAMGNYFEDTMVIFFNG